MADVTQAASTLLAHVAITNADTAAGFSVVGTEVDVRTFLSATVMVYHAIVEATESNDPGLQYILQGQPTQLPLVQAHRLQCPYTHAQNPSLHLDVRHPSIDITRTFQA